jgi:hypothetical protein
VAPASARDAFLHKAGGDTKESGNERGSEYGSMTHGGGEETAMTGGVLVARREGETGRERLG